MRLLIQIFNNESWETTSKNYFNFTNWADAVTFAYRLSAIHQKEIRVENKGQGHYFHPSNSDNYLA